MVQLHFYPHASPFLVHPLPFRSLPLPSPPQVRHDKGGDGSNGSRRVTSADRCEHGRKDCIAGGRDASSGGSEDGLMSPLPFESSLVRASPLHITPPLPSYTTPPNPASVQLHHTHSHSISPHSRRPISSPSLLIGKVIGISEYLCWKAGRGLVIASGGPLVACCVCVMSRVQSRQAVGTGAVTTLCASALWIEVGGLGLEVVSIDESRSALKGRGSLCCNGFMFWDLFYVTLEVWRPNRLNPFPRLLCCSTVGIFDHALRGP